MTNREKLIEIYEENLAKNHATVIQLRDGDYYLMAGPNFFICKSGFMYYVNDTLKANVDNKYDVVNVYSSSVTFGGLSCIFDSLKFIHSFETVELTMDEIAEKFGVAVKYLKIKK